MNDLVRQSAGSLARAGATPSALASLAPSPSWLAAWKPTETLPASARAEVEASIPALEAALRPAPTKALAVAVGRLVDWIVDFGILPLPDDQRARQDKIGRLAARYREHLHVLPADLLARCVDETMASHRFRNLPLPAEMIARVSGEWSRRRTALGGCHLALRIGRFDAPAVDAKDRVRPEQVRALRLELAAAASARAMPGAEGPEAGEPPPPSEPRRDRGAAA